MEYASGGELFDRIVKANRFSEDEARYFFQQLISGVAWCHREVRVVVGGSLVGAWSPPCCLARCQPDTSGISVGRADHGLKSWLLLGCRACATGT